MRTKNLYSDLLKISLFLGFFVISFGLLISCGSSGAYFKEADYTELQELVNSKNFKIENDWANPSGGGNINLIGNPNFIKFQGDSVEVYLPYFGVRHSGGGYNSEGGFKYEGLARDLEITEKSEKGMIELEFETEQDNEKVEFFVTLYPNNKTITNVNTSQRTTISYQGNLSESKED